MTKHRGIERTTNIASWQAVKLCVSKKTKGKTNMSIENRCMWRKDY